MIKFSKLTQGQGTVTIIIFVDPALGKCLHPHQPPNPRYPIPQKACRGFSDPRDPVKLAFLRGPKQADIRVIKVNLLDTGYIHKYPLIRYIRS